MPEESNDHVANPGLTASEAEIMAAALACARGALGDVGLVTWQPTAPPAPLPATMVLLTDQGGRNVRVAAAPATGEALPDDLLARTDTPPRLLLTPDV